MPRKDIVELQSKLLRQTIEYSSLNSLFYKNQFKKLGINPEEIRSVKDLQKKKFFTTKDDLRQSYPFGMLAVPRNNVAEMHATSGTTGTPTLGLHTQRDLEDWGEIAASISCHVGHDKG